MDGYDTSREAFIGLYNGFGNPQVVRNDAPTNSDAHVGAHRQPLHPPRIEAR